VSEQQLAQPPDESGHPGVDGAVAMLRSIAKAELVDQPDRYDEAHQALEDALRRSPARHLQPEE
jgi:hypothetical protein